MIDSLKELSWFDEWWCMADLSWCCKMSG